MAERPSGLCDQAKKDSLGIFVEDDGHTPMRGCRSSENVRLWIAVCRHLARVSPNTRIRSSPAETQRAFDDCMTNFVHWQGSASVSIEMEADSLQGADGGLYPTSPDFPPWESHPPARLDLLSDSDRTWPLTGDALAIPWVARAAEVLAMPGVTRKPEGVFLPDADFAGLQFHRSCVFTWNRVSAAKLSLVACDPGARPDECKGAIVRLVGALGTGVRRQRDGCRLKWDRDGLEIRVADALRGQFIVMDVRDLDETVAHLDFRRMRMESKCLDNNQLVNPQADALITVNPD